MSPSYQKPASHISEKGVNFGLGNLGFSIPEKTGLEKTKLPGSYQ